MAHLFEYVNPLSAVYAVAACGVAFMVYVFIHLVRESHSTRSRRRRRCGSDLENE